MRIDQVVDSVILKPRNVLLLAENLTVELIDLLGVFFLDFFDLKSVGLSKVSYLFVQIFILELSFILFFQEVANFLTA